MIQRKEKQLPKKPKSKKPTKLWQTIYNLEHEIELLQKQIKELEERLNESLSEINVRLDARKSR